MNRSTINALARLFAISTAGSVLSISAGAQSNFLSGKSDHFLLARSATGTSRVIVRFNHTLRPTQERFLANIGADIYRHLPFIGSAAIALPARNLPKLAALPFVEHLSEDVQVRKFDEFTVGNSGAGTAFQQQGLTGKNITVAVVDSGIRSQPDLANPATNSSRVIGSVNFVPLSASADDVYGHGTHVAGIVAGNGAASSGPSCFRTFYGIARQANLVNVRVLDANGQSSVSTVLSGLQWVATNRTKYKIRVVNLSMGHSVGESYTTDPLCKAVEQLWTSGIVVVCAAGNDGRQSDLAILTNYQNNEGYGTAYGSIASPGNDPYVLTVGAMKKLDGIRADDRIATYSSRGPSRLDLVLKPDIVAPGNQVISLRRPLSTLELTSPTNAVPPTAYNSQASLLTQSSYFTLSGTSMAAPVVAGAAALLLEANAALTPDTIKARLMLSADKWADPSGNGDPCTYGAGYLNIPAALQCGVTATMTACSPKLTQDAYGNVLISPDGLLSANLSIWGTSVTDTRAMWGTRAIWGTNTLSSSRAIWGTSVWGDRAIWGTDIFSVDLGPLVLGGE